MSSISIGDLSNAFLQQKRSVALREDLFRLSEELSSGRVADVRDILAGNHSYLTGLERSLEVLGGYSVANSEAEYLTAAMQLSLEQIQNISGDLAVDLLLAGGGPIAAVAGNPSDNARVQLIGIVNSINDDIAGRSLFAGTATDRPPLPDADVLIDTLRTVVTGLTSPTDIIAAAEAWFASPAGYDAVIYSGSNTALAPFNLSQTEQVSLDVKANDDAIKGSLMYTALAGLVDDPALALNVPQQSDMLRLLGENLQSNQDRITRLRAKIGFVEETCGIDFRPE